jgi:hypothetical protein
MKVFPSLKKVKVEASGGKKNTSLEVKRDRGVAEL